MEPQYGGRATYFSGENNSMVLLWRSHNFDEGAPDGAGPVRNCHVHHVGMWKYRSRRIKYSPLLYRRVIVAVDAVPYIPWIMQSPARHHCEPSKAPLRSHIAYLGLNREIMMPKSCLLTDVSGTAPFGRASGCSSGGVPTPLSVRVVALKGVFLSLWSCRLERTTYIFPTLLYISLYIL